MIFKIEEAQREGARLVLGLGGVSGGGKTFSALQLAWGLANGDASKVGLMCTENRRGRLYADCLKDPTGKVHRFKIGDLAAPFSPERYAEGIQAFVKAGVEVLVIDSVSHEWEGIGGCEDIANAPDQNGRAPKVARWNEAKRAHKGFMNTLLASPLHVIACLRAREKVKMVKRDGKTEYESLGVQPIQEKNFVFELTASVMLWDGGRSRDVLKCPAELTGIFGETGGQANGYLTSEHGRAVRAWVDGGNKVDDAVKIARDTLQMTCEQGLAALQKAWGELPAKLRKAIGPDGCPDDLKRSAQEFDRQREAAKNQDAAKADDLSDAITQGATSAANEDNSQAAA